MHLWEGSGSWGFSHVWVPKEPQRRHWTPKAGVETFMSHLTQVLETEFGSSGRAANGLNHYPSF